MRSREYRQSATWQEHRSVFSLNTTLSAVRHREGERSEIIPDHNILGLNLGHLIR